MNKIILLLLLFIPEFQESRFDLALDRSQMKWHGGAPGSGHTGTLKAVSGFLVVSNSNAITKGQFVIDMNSITNSDQKEAQERKDLEDHLKSDDFFSTEKYPTALFTVTQTKSALDIARPDRLMVTGLLTIKGITNSITFPASVEISEKIVRVSAVLTINRIKWDITYHSASFMDKLLDGAITDDIGMTLDLVMTRK